MPIKKNLVVVVGTWTNREGETKKNYKTIGQLHEGSNGDYITLESDVNLAAYPRKEGDTRVMVSLYDPKPKEERPARTAPTAPARAVDDDPWE